jgi:hypothetical protein
MLKTKLISGFITVTTATISIVGFAAEAIAASLYLTPGETSTVRGSYEVSVFGEYDALIQWNFFDLYWGALQFVDDSLFEESSDGTQYTITNDAISRVGIRENAKINYRPLSARYTPGGETTAGSVDWSLGRTLSMEVGVRTLDIDALFERVTENYMGLGEATITSIQDMHNLYLGEVETRFTIGGHTSYGSLDLYLDLSNYNPPTADSPQSVPEPGSAIALVALAIAGLSSVKKNS